jgi:replicative DNA helicase
MVSGAKDVLGMLADPLAEMGEITDKANRVFRGIHDSSSDCRHIKGIVPSVVNELEMRWVVGHYGNLTGLKDVDRAIGGFEAGHLYVIAGRPSMGKTALALTMCLNIAAESPVAFVSLEMPEHDLTLRALSSVSSVPYYNIQHNAMSDFQSNKFTEAVRHISGLNLYFRDQPAGVSEIRILVERLKRNGGLDGVFVDYLQLMKRATGNTRDEEIGNITRELKEICLEYGIWVCLLSQLSRQVEYRTNKRPTLPDLRESGCIEQDADVVMFVYRPHYYGEECAEGKTEVIVAKNRNGAVTTVEVVFIPDCIKFGNLTPLTIEPPHTNYS